jgi:hypothetical protein
VGTGIEVFRTPIKTPRAKAICERFTLRVPGSVRRECLDHTMIVSEAHLRRVFAAYMGYFNRARPHQGIKQRVPAAADAAEHSAYATGQIARFLFWAVSITSIDGSRK